MHNPYDPFGSIRADKVGAFRVFRVLFGGDRQVPLLCLSSDGALPGYGNAFATCIYRIRKRFWIVLSFTLCAIDRRAQFGKDFTQRTTYGYLRKLTARQRIQHRRGFELMIHAMLNDVIRQRCRTHPAGQVGSDAARQQRPIGV